MHPQFNPTGSLTTVRITLIAALVALTTALAPAAALADDGSYTQILCANPDTGQGLGVSTVDGLTAPASATAWRATISASQCSTEPKTATNAITLGPSSAAAVPYNGYAALHYAVADPALTLDSARLYRSFESGDHPFEVSTRIIQHGGANPADAADPMNGWDWFWSGQSEAAGRADRPFAPENVVDVEHNGRSFSITAQCRDTGGTCAPAPGEWSYRFFGGEAHLRDAHSPVIDAVSGSLLDGGAVTTEQLTFRAHDAGAGIYRFKLVVDDEEMDVRDLTPGSDLDANDRLATCFDVSPADDDPYEFAHQQPCPASLERTLTISTSDVSDGPHYLRAVVEDAAGNETALVDREVVVDNHPVPEPDESVTPTISGAPIVGAPLSGENGGWRGANQFDYYWQRCPTETTCTVLVDAPGRTYVPTDDDVGARMRFLVVARNDVGEWTQSTSSFSEPVQRTATGAGGGASTPGATAGPTPAAPAQVAAADTPAAHAAAATPQPQLNGRGASADARLRVALPNGKQNLRTLFTARQQLVGRLTDASGKPIAGAVLQITARESSAGAVPAAIGTTVTGEDGAFSYRAPGGPSRRITVAYRTRLADDRPAATASMRLVVPAEASLRVRAARPGRTTWMLGRLRYLGRPGVQIQVQALDGRRWRTFDTTTTRRGGRFRYGYRFKPTATGRRFGLRVVVSSPIYPFARGASRAVFIRVPR